MSDLGEAFARLHLAAKRREPLRLSGRQAEALAKHLDRAQDAADAAARILRNVEREMERDGIFGETPVSNAAQALEAIVEPNPRT